MLSPTEPITPGKYYAWNAEYGAVPTLQHTVAQLLVVALDIRENAEPYILYVVNGTPPVMTCCRLEHFRASCSPYQGTPWTDGNETQAAMDHAVEVIRQSTTPGHYIFTSLPE